MRPGCLAAELCRKHGFSDAIFYIHGLLKAQEPNHGQSMKASPPLDGSQRRAARA
jgi:hypothetical protein